MDEAREKAAYEAAERCLTDEEVEQELNDLPGPCGWPVLGEEAFHGPIGELVELILPHTESHPAALLIQSLVMFGNVIGRNCYFEADGAKHHTNLYAVIVGSTAKGRKGTSLRQCERILSALDEQWAKERLQSGLSSGEGFIHAVRDPVYKNGELIDEGESDKRLMLVETEFASVLRVMERDGNTLSTQIRQAWDTGHLRVLTKAKPEKACNAHISILGHITAEELKRYLTATESVNGFANRFLWLCAERSKCLPDGGEIEKVNFAPVLKSLRAALEHSTISCLMKRDPKARDLWHAVYPGLSEGRPGLIGAMIGRAEAQVMRLACVYALLDCADEIGVNHINAGLVLWKYCEDSVRYVFGDKTGDHVADRILQALREHTEGMTRTQISNIFSRNESSERLSQALSNLKKQGKAYSKLVKTNGREVEVLCVTNTN